MDIDYKEIGFTPIPTKKVPVAIYEQIRNKILSGELKPGDKLPSERELIDMFQRSRPTIREALRMLESKNYITISRNKGAIVNKLSVNEVQRTLNKLVRLNLITMEDIVEVRKICESISVTWAAQNRNEVDLNIMSDILNKSIQQIDNYHLFLEYGIEFNNAIARSSQNEVLYIVSRMTSEFGHDKFLLSLEHTEAGRRREICNTIFKQHQEIFHAIKNQDVEKAKYINLIHIKQTFESLK